MTLLDLPGDPPRAEDGEERYPRLTIVDRGLISLRISDRSGLWIATSAQFSERFGPTDRLGRDRLLVMDELDPSLHEYLTSLFADVISGPSPSFLSINEIRDALLAPHFADLAVGVLVSEPRKAIVIVRANLERRVVPWAWFRPSGDGTLPHFGDVEVIDSGLAIRLGSYEASMDAILYEFDRDYRARDRRRQVATDVSFGASLRRLRIQRGVSRDGFPGISGKEIGRIERGDVVRPHGATIRVIADTLGVEPAEIETY